MIVIKVGGSLYDLPDLGLRLRCFLARLPEENQLVVPGGGPTADVVRHLDRIHRLGDQAAHWLALRACTLNAHFLVQLLPGARVVAHPRGTHGLCVLDVLAFGQEDEGSASSLPPIWEATSDALAGRAAAVAGAQLVLLKSVDWPDELSWEDAAKRGHVDPHFPEIVRSAGLRVTVVNLRRDPGG